MKLIALAAALAMSGAAFAQTAPATDAQGNIQSEDGTKGGYAPTAPLYPNGTPQPGQTVIFVPNTQTPTEAFPPPAPKAEYPICKKNQFDGCRQRGG